MNFYIHTLGCKVNNYESSVMQNIMEEAGYIYDEYNPNIVIINTCTVTQAASSKSLKMIRHFIKNYPNAIILVAGCMSQVEKEKVAQIKGVSIIIGNINKSKIKEYINEYQKNKKQIIDIQNIDDVSFEEMKLSNTNKTRAFVKIQDGCNNWCTFCIIPRARGNIRSKDMNEVLLEVTNLIKKGHHEVVLTGIHTGHYGQDKNYNFYDLLLKLTEIEGLKRLRISSIEVNEITDDIIKLMKNNKVIVSHLHIPLQSGCNKILKLMNRRYLIEDYIKIIDKIKKAREDISITTDVIVGFPGETDADFQETVSNIKKIKFMHLHVFPYSERKDTKASLFKDKVDNKTKKERVKYLMNISKEIEKEYIQKFIQKEVNVIFEQEEDGYLKGHTGNYLLVKAKGNKSLINKEIKVLLTQEEYPIVVGKII